MSIPDPKIGLVINFSFLWGDEARRGVTEGIKDRPCIIIGLKEAAIDTTVLVAPITHRPPSQEANIEIPAPVKAHLGLDDQRSWIVTSEVNRFTWWRSPDLRPITRGQGDGFVFGMAPENLTKKAREQVRTYTLDRTLTVTGRDDWQPDIEDDLYPDRA